MAENPTAKSSTQANLSDLVKEMVKEMDANEFYSRTDLYDESAEEPWFSIDITLERKDGKPPAPNVSLHKPWSEFQRLHYLLFTDEFGCNEAVKEQLPTLPAGPRSPPTTNGDDTYAGKDGEGGSSGGSGGLTGSPDLANGLDAYLNALLAVPAVVQSQVFSGFLEDRSSVETSKEDVQEEESGGRSLVGRRTSDPSGGSRDSVGGGTHGENRSLKIPETAIDFLLQPFDYGKAYLPRRAEHTERIDVIRGESVVWKFKVMDNLDIDFSAVFRPHPVAVPSRRFDHATGGSGSEATSTSNSDGDEKAMSSPTPKGESSAGTLKSGGTTVAQKARRRSSWWGSHNDGGGGGAAPGAPQGDGGGQGGEQVETEDETLNDQAVHLRTRYGTGAEDSVQGSFTCPADGTCILRWDNSYSRLRGKRLCFVVESATVQTMRAAIEAAGATDHKRRANRSAAAQTILDSGHGEVRVAVRAETCAGEGGDSEGRRGSDILGGGGDGLSSRGDVGNGNVSDTIYYSHHYSSFGRVRRVAAALLRDLGAIVDARQNAARSGSGANGCITGDGDGSHLGQGSLDGSGSRRNSSGGNVDAAGVETLVARFEALEDEAASSSARRAQSEAQAKVLLATLQKANTKADRLERSLNETREELTAAHSHLRETSAARDEAKTVGAAASAKLQASEEQLLRAKREKDLLQAERSVWQVARSGIQEELAKVVAELELERHRHEDTSRALAKAHESRAHAEAEAARLSRRLEEERGGAGGARAALAAERQAAHLAREEAEDARTAVAELDAAVAELGAQKRVLVAGLRARERALGDRCAVAEARAEEAGMMRRAAETRVRELEEDAERREAAQADGEIRMQRLRAEKKVLLAEIRRGVTAGVGGVAGIDMASAGVAPGRVGEGGGDVENTSELDRMSEVEGGDGGDGVDSGGGGVRGGSSSPRASEESAQDRKATLKQLSRQLVHLRERQHHLREDLRADPANMSARRLEADVDRAVQNLEIKIRRLLSAVTAGEDNDSATGSPPVAASATTRKRIASSVETQSPVEVETYSV